MFPLLLGPRLLGPEYPCLPKRRSPLLASLPRRVALGRCISTSGQCSHRSDGFTQITRMGFTQSIIAGSVALSPEIASVSRAAFVAGVRLPSMQKASLTSLFRENCWIKGFQYCGICALGFEETKRNSFKTIYLAVGLAPWQGLLFNTYSSLLLFTGNSPMQRI